MGFSLDPDHPPPQGVLPLLMDDSGPVCGVGGGLRRMFDDVVTSPMPQKLLDLCDALEEAFQRGKLSAGCDRGKTSA